MSRKRSPGRARLSDREAEMFRCLWHLRYLAAEQIHRVWYQDRSLDNARSRLSRLKRKGLLAHTRLDDDQFPGAWRLTKLGCARAEQLWFDTFDPTAELTWKHLPHQLHTNELWLGLRNGQWRWGSMPFDWIGSHRAGREFRAFDERLGYQRDRMLRPDAIITPASGRPGPRVFLELDNRTESIDSKTGRTSIRGKLKTYAEFLVSSGRGSWYEHHFTDQRPPILLFAVTHSRRVQVRRRSIQNVARQHLFPVECEVATNVEAIREICKGKTLGQTEVRWREERGAKFLVRRREVDTLAAGYRLLQRITEAGGVPDRDDAERRLNGMRRVLYRFATELKR